MNRRSQKILEKRMKTLGKSQNETDAKQLDKTNLSLSRVESLRNELQLESLESPPSNYTRIGVETKNWIKKNPVLTRTLEKQLTQTNILVLRKIKAMDFARTPKK